ncbi:MAG: Hint domain-containing protein [Pseudomonadota bacterium]
MPIVAIYDWSLYTTPSSISQSDLEGDTQGESTPGWLGGTFTFNGGAPTQLDINDDDGFFEDAYVETGGSQTLATPVTINGVLFAAGSVVENEFSLLDAGGNEVWVVRIAGVNVGFTYPNGDTPSPGDDFIGATARDGDPADSQDGVGTLEPYAGIICFTAGTLIETETGARPVEELSVGDRVLTVDRGVQTIRWCSTRKLRFQNDFEDAKPVMIKAGAFGGGLPERDMVVSPQHRFVFRHAESGADVFVAAKALTCLPGIRTMRGKKSVEYIHFAFDRHEVVLASGVQAESCYMGPVTLEDLPQQEKDRVSEIFPQISFAPVRGYGPTARPVLKVQHARRHLIAGHLAYRAEPAPMLAHRWAQRTT